MTMYNRTVAVDDHSDHAALACQAFVWTSVAVSGLGFWSKGLLPTVILTVIMLAVVRLLSFTLGRLVLAARAKQWRLLAQMLALGGVFVTLEAFLNHLGLVWLNQTYGLTDPAHVELAAWFLPLVNVFATDSFTREIRLPKPPADKAPVTQNARTATEINADNDARMRKWEGERRADPDLYLGAAKDRKSLNDAIAHIRGVILGTQAA